jgi:hypothetical protein
MSLEATMISVWRQALVENAPLVTLETGSYKIRRTSKLKLREVDFPFNNQWVRGLEQNPDTTSRFAALARQGKKVMQFLVNRTYIGNVVDGKAFLYKPGHELDQQK